MLEQQKLAHNKKLKELLQVHDKGKYLLKNQNFYLNKIIEKLALQIEQKLYDMIEKGI